MVLDTSHENEISEINMTPFVDIVLVILVIFMVTATFVSQGKIPLQLPKASTQEHSKIKEKPTVISITKEGEVYYDDEAISMDNLQEKIATIKEKEPKILIRSDAKTPFEFVVKVIDTCKKQNISAFAIQTTANQP